MGVLGPMAVSALRLAAAPATLGANAKIIQREVELPEDLAIAAGTASAG
jgi:hypothetical protein